MEVLAHEWQRTVTYRRSRKKAAILRHQNEELRVSRADLAGKLLEQCKVIDELRATVAGYKQANHNQSLLIQELHARIAKLEADTNVADNDDTPHWVKIMRDKGSG